MELVELVELVVLVMLVELLVVKVMVKLLTEIKLALDPYRQEQRWLRPKAFKSHQTSLHQFGS